MKKNLLAFFIVLSFFGCLITSYFVEKALGIEGDYLSAFATLVAALVAFYLFSDWKVEHKFKLLEQYQTSLKETSSELISQYLSAKRTLDCIEGTEVHVGEQNLKDGQKHLSEFLKTLNKISFLFVEYKWCLDSLNETELVKQTIRKVEAQIGVISKIHSEYINDLPIYVFNVNDSIRILTVIQPWHDRLVNNYTYCQLELSMHYFELLNEKKLKAHIAPFLILSS